MKHFSLKIISAFLLGMIFYCSVPRSSQAQTAWGGLDVGDYYFCDCTEAVYTWFEPLYLNSSIPLTGALTWYSGGSFIYENYYLHPGAWGAGFYIPGLQACWYYAVYSCIPYPAIGHIYEAGSSP